MKNLSNFFYLLLFIFTLIFFINTPVVKAQVDYCDGGSDFEFHSLRPYPGKPCAISSKALFCSNDLIFTEGFDESKFPSCVDQAPDDTGDFTCIPSSRDGKIAAHDLIAELNDSEFPILGNTEDVSNRISKEDTLDDVTKVNEYVSWYLNGVIGRAEYGSSKDTDYNVVNLSGPLKKLTPQAFQDAQRIDIVDAGSKQTQNYNQIVVCGEEKVLNNLFEQIKEIINNLDINGLKNILNQIIDFMFKSFSLDNLKKGLSVINDYIPTISFSNNTDLKILDWIIKIVNFISQGTTNTVKEAINLLIEHLPDSNQIDILNIRGALKSLTHWTVDQINIDTLKTILNSIVDWMNDNNLIDKLADIFNIGKTYAIPCYVGDGSKAQGDTYRLTSWKGTFAFGVVINKAVDFFLSLNILIPEWTEDVIRESVGNHWKELRPPLPWEKDPYTEDVPMSALAYRKYYSEWHGKSCVIIPAINYLICMENILVPNKYSELFPYVPLSKNTDKLGENLVNSIQYLPVEGTKISNISPTDVSKTNPAPLYFAHTQESKDLLEMLNKIFVPMNCTNSGSGLTCSPLPNIKSPTTVENTVCSTAIVRTNPGDQLFPNGPTQFIIPKVTYQIDSLPCNVIVTKETVCNTKEKPKQCPGDLRVCCEIITDKKVTCNAEVVITVKTDSTTPYADEIFLSAVAGSGSAFRKMFPKIEPGAPIECIADIPSVSAVTYDASKSQKPTGGTQTFDVKNPTTGSIGSPQLTFPHIGSVYEYFLKGIQTALRPKGYGEPISSGTLCSNIPPPGGEINCDQSAPDIIIPGLFTKEQTHILALNWVSQKPGNHVIECYNDTVRRAQSSGVNMGLTIALWLHESNASNYDLGYLQDFGAYWPGTFPGYVAQITEYFRRAKDSLYTKNGPICNGRSDVKDDFMAWALVYKSGKCDPTESGAAQFYSEIKDTFKLVAPGCEIPTSTTDNTCP